MGTPETAANQGFAGGEDGNPRVQDGGGVSGMVPTDGMMCKGHSSVPGAACCRVKCLCPPQTVFVWDMGVYSQQTSSLDQQISRRPQVSAGVSGG